MSYTIKEPNTNVSKQDLIDDCNRITKELNKANITQREYQDYGNYSVKTIYNKFGSWSSFISEVGMELTTNIGSTISDSKLFENLESVWAKLGRQPKYTEMVSPLSQYHASTYERRFGSWIKALKRFADYMEAEPSVSPIVQKQDDIYKHTTPRNINLRLRFKVLKRDSFKCVKCGNNPASNPEVKLQVDHIKPYSKGGETIIDNLQTLCEDCNQGKSNLHEI